MYVCPYIHVRVYIHTCTCVNTFIYVCTYTHTCTCIHTHTSTHTHTHTHTVRGKRQRPIMSLVAAPPGNETLVSQVIVLITFFYIYKQI
jgi:hypothetical protein